LTHQEDDPLKSMKERFMFKPQGIIPAMVTPLDKDEGLNETAMRGLVNHLIKAGVHGLFALGSQGEFWAFDAVEKRRILEIVVSEAGGRVPVFGGTTAVSTWETITLTQMAEDVGVDAVSILPPYYVSPSQQELYEHFAAIAQATSLPILLYNNPGRTGVKLAPKTVSRLAELENIVGIKDSSGDLSLTLEYIQGTPYDFAVLMGRDTLVLAGLLYGCAGAIAATANVVPNLVVDIFERFKTGDLAGAKQAQEQLAPLRYAFGWGTFPVVVKEAVDLLGLAAGPARGPVGPLSQDARDKLAQVLTEMGVLKSA
jgi:4-hydroxy-tetrahydrodipicolinate synthase